MINTKYLLLASACVLLSGSSQASEAENLTFSYSGSLLVNTYTTHTPMELKPISHFNSDNAVKLAAVCAIGGGGCSGLEFGKSNNSMLLDKAAQCTDEGYASSCPSGYVLDYTKQCLYNKSYYKCRVCSHTCLAGSLNNCSSTQVLTGTTSNDCLETCYQCRDKTCAEGGYAPYVPPCMKGSSVSFANKTCYTNITAQTCEDNGYKSHVPTNNKCDSTTICGSHTCYTNCKQPTCEDGGYKSAVPANNVCTDVTYYGRTCKKDCYQPTCEDGGYKSGVPTNYVCSPVSYYGRSCYKDCYQPQCAAGGYKDAVPTNNKCTSVAYYGRNCYKDCYQPQCSAGGYLASCPNGYTCTSQTYYGRICYKDCKTLLPILYSDLTTSNTIISNKTPIGIVFDTNKRLALALDQANQLSWSVSQTDIPGLENCDSPRFCDTDGKANTTTIIAFGKANNISYPAAEYCYNYTTHGTTAGDWFLPSYAELFKIYQKKSQINATLNLLGKPLFKEKDYWSSTENDNIFSWRAATCESCSQIYNGTNYGDGIHGAWNKQSNQHSVRPVLAF